LPPPEALNLENGIPENDLADGAMLVGQVGEEAVLLARRGAEVFAIGAACTHYGGPLGEGLMVEDTVRCPWHHACFSLRTGGALAAPALNASSCWRVERCDGRVFVREQISEAGPRMPPKPRPTAGATGHMVIIGGGAAGYAAAETLRREGYGGSVTIVSADEASVMPEAIVTHSRQENVPKRKASWLAASDCAGTGVTLRCRRSAPSVQAWPPRLAPEN
jgi:apoptosis-inducing factor 3